MTIVIALGGNALGKDPKEQLELVKNTAKSIVDLVEEGHKIIVSHGNGPQVGMINLAMEEAHKYNDAVPQMPFPECGAMSQGYIGYHLQQQIQKELKIRGIDIDCASVVTQVLVDKNDSAFENPTKPIGSFYTKEEALKIEEENTNYIFKEDAGRGYRRVVASPNPIKIVELNLIKKLVENSIVIAAGGGGIPVIEDDDYYVGVPAVIDKDMTSARLAKDLNADILLILTAVDEICINYNTENEKKLSSLTVNEAKKYIEEGHFAKGSMLPKVNACLEFLNGNDEKIAIVTSLNNAKYALRKEKGTIIKNGG